MNPSATPTSGDYRQALTQLRCDARIMSDVPFSTVREAARRMLQLIENLELFGQTAPAPEVVTWLPTIDPKSIPNEIVLQEIARRVRVVRKIPKLCITCRQKAARARGLCMHCYDKWRARERKVAKRALANANLGPN